MGYRDENGEPLLEKILDAAGQKGTGKWTAISSLEVGVPLTLIGEAVYSRILSSQKEERLRAAQIIKAKVSQLDEEKEEFVNAIHDALFASKIVSYAQGYVLMREAAKENNWNLNYGGIALMWRGGCIIRSAFLGKIKDAFDHNPELENLILDSYFHDKLQAAQEGWRKVVSVAARIGIPVPTFSSALAYFDGYRTANLPANLLQAQRDYFGAHTYERVDKDRGEFFHTNWTGRGGDTASSTYQV